MRREASSRTQDRARLRTAALAALYTLKLAVPEEPVEISEVRHVGLDTNGASPNRACGVGDLGPASSSDEESYTLSGQLVR